MAEQSTTANERSNVVLRRILPALTAALTVWALVSSFFALDVTEYGLVTRFGRVVRVLAEPGLQIVAPFDRVVRLDKRILFFRPAPSEFLTIDKNLGVDSLVTWRIADPERFLAALATPAAAEQRLSDVVLAEIGAVMGRYPSRRYRARATAIRERPHARWNRDHPQSGDRPIYVASALA